MVVVADGMGGHDNGALASAAAVQAMLRLYERGRPRDPSAALIHFVRSAHDRLRARAAVGGSTNMGTTLTVAWFFDNTVWWVHVGDSRLYHLRGDGLSLLTRDHVRSEFARRDGRPVPTMPDALSQSFIFGSRGLGDDAKIRLDAGLDSGRLRLMPDDRLLLCSDGVSAALHRHDLASILRPDQSGAPSTTATTLAEAAMEAGTTDNVTALVVHVGANVMQGEETQWHLVDNVPTEPLLQHRPPGHEDG